MPLLEKKWHMRSFTPAKGVVEKLGTAVNGECVWKYRHTSEQTAKINRELRGKNASDKEPFIQPIPGLVIPKKRRVRRGTSLILHLKTFTKNAQSNSLNAIALRRLQH